MNENYQYDPRRHMTPPRPPGIDPGIAAILTLFVPGLGQMCQGRVFTGLVTLPMVLLGYMLFIVPGLVLHLVAVVDAAQYRR